MVQIYLILLCSSQSKDNFGLIFVNIITILPHNFLKLFYSHLPFFRVFAEIIPEVFTIPIVLHKSMLELVDLVHIDFFILELTRNGLDLLVEVFGEIQLRSWSLKTPLTLLPLSFRDGVPPDSLQLHIRTLEWINCFALLL